MYKFSKRFPTLHPNVILAVVAEFVDVVEVVFGRGGDGLRHGRIYCPVRHAHFRRPMNAHLQKHIGKEMPLKVGYARAVVLFKNCRLQQQQQQQQQQQWEQEQK